MTILYTFYSFFPSSTNDSHKVINQALDGYLWTLNLKFLKLFSLERERKINVLQKALFCIFSPDDHYDDVTRNKCHKPCRVRDGISGLVNEWEVMRAHLSLKRERMRQTGSIFFRWKSDLVITILPRSSSWATHTPVMLLSWPTISFYSSSTRSVNKISFQGERDTQNCSIETWNLRLIFSFFFFRAFFNDVFKNDTKLVHSVRHFSALSRSIYHRDCLSK